MTCLGRYMDSHPDLYNLNLLEDQDSVCVRARGGLRISRLARDRDLLSFDVSPDICFIQIGENDVLSFSVEVIVRDILALASYIPYLSLDSFFVTNHGHHRSISMNASLL